MRTLCIRSGYLGLRDSAGGVQARVHGYTCGTIDIQAQLEVPKPAMRIVEAYMSGHASAAPGTGSCDCITYS